jgi:ATP-dependent RNA helicase DDX5/DBP2
MTDPSQLEQSAAVASDIVPSKMKVVDLREELKQRSLDTTGLKAVLVKRLEEYIVSSTNHKMTEGTDVMDVAAGIETDPEAFMTTHEIVIHEAGAPPPCVSLQAAPFPAPIVELLLKQPGFVVPSGVQAASWPLAVTGRDVLAIAKTGSGKTLGYLLPALARCQKEKAAANGRPICMIMAPTRELALQIHSEAIKFGKCVGCRSVAVYGGASREQQAESLAEGCEIVVGTPGRVMDMMDMKGWDWDDDDKKEGVWDWATNSWAKEVKEDRKEDAKEGAAGAGADGGKAAESSVACNVSSVSMLVLDEADRMLDMGFEKDIHAIVAELPKVHQTLFYSATWPKSVQHIANDLLDNPVKVTVGQQSGKLTANKNVRQRVLVVKQRDKWRKFLELLKDVLPGGADEGKRVIVFANTKKDVKSICEYCWDEGLNVDSLSGDKKQSQRESVLRRFRSGKTTMIIATDVAARGLDINDVARIINYDFPNPDDYIHRIGRTGRAGAVGTADTFFTPGDKMHAKELIRILRDADHDIPAALENFKSNKREPRSKKQRPAAKPAAAVAAVADAATPVEVADAATPVEVADAATPVVKSDGPTADDANASAANNECTVEQPTDGASTDATEKLEKQKLERKLDQCMRS